MRMGLRNVSLFLAAMFALLPEHKAQISSDVSGQTIWKEIQTRNELTRYTAWVKRAGLQSQFNGPTHFTVFAPNDTAFEMTPRDRLNIIEQTPESIRRWVNTFTLLYSYSTSRFQDNSAFGSFENQHNVKLWIAKKRRNDWYGMSQYYVDGAMIVSPDVRCVNGILHIIDRVPDQPSLKSVEAYIMNPDLPSTMFGTGEFVKFMNLIDNGIKHSIIEIKDAPKITMFVPSDKAINSIPREYYSRLTNNLNEMDNVIRRHFIKNEVIMTSWVQHREQYELPAIGATEYAIFRKQTYLGTERVYVNSDRVNARIIYGNISVSNGVIHIIDRVLGYVYYNAMEQIYAEPQLSAFRTLLETAKDRIQQALRNQDNREVTLFAFTNNAYQELQNLPWIRFDNDMPLREKVVELHILQLGQIFEVVNVRGEYESRINRNSLYYNWPLTIYNRYDVTFVEAGYVRARVIKADIGVQNGVVHYIDRVLGVATRDLPSIMCEDNWLHATYTTYKLLGLLDDFSDCRITVDYPCASLYHSFTVFDDTVSTGNSYPRKSNPCPSNTEVEQFTVFMPNGSVIEEFQQRLRNRQITGDPERYKYVLKRHIIRGRTVYLDQLAQGETRLTTDTGDHIIIYKNKYDSVKPTYDILYGSKRSRIIHSDLGATNGVIHIIADILTIEKDKTGALRSCGQQSCYTHIEYTVILLFALLFSYTFL